MHVARCEAENHLETLEARVDSLAEVVGRFEEVVDDDAASAQLSGDGQTQVNELQEGCAVVQEALRRVEASNRSMDGHMQRFEESYESVIDRIMWRCNEFRRRKDVVALSIEGGADHRGSPQPRPRQDARGDHCARDQY